MIQQSTKAAKYQASQPIYTCIQERVRQGMRREIVINVKEEIHDRQITTGLKMQ